MRLGGLEEHREHPLSETLFDGKAISSFYKLGYMQSALCLLYSQ